MEKRDSKRISSDIETMLVSRSLNFRGTIKDISHGGLCISIHDEQNVCQLMDGMFFEVRFNLKSGDDIYLQCKVIRTHRESAGGQDNRVGMKIINQPPAYRQFLEEVNIRS